MWHLTIANKAKPDRGTYFPITKDAGNAADKTCPLAVGDAVFTSEAPEESISFRGARLSVILHEPEANVSDQIQPVLIEVRNATMRTIDRLTPFL